MCEEFLIDNDETRGGAITNVKKMEIFLRHIADPGFQIGVAEDVGVHRTTVCKTFKFVLYKICEKVCTVFIKLTIDRNYISCFRLLNGLSFLCLK